MSPSSQPTVPFVLPVYETLHTHLSNMITERKVYIRIRQGGQSALEKLQKYCEKALGNHYYMLGTGESNVHRNQELLLNSTQLFIPLFVLSGSEIWP